MKTSERVRSQRGAIRLGLADILTALILLGILLVASYLQFPVYQRVSSPNPSPQAAPKPK